MIISNTTITFFIIPFWLYLNFAKGDEIPIKHDNCRAWNKQSHNLLLNIVLNKEC